MATVPSSDAINGAAPGSYFAQERALLINEIAATLDQTLTSLNRLNRSLESVISIGHEFSSVEALWSRFEEVMRPAGEGPDTGVVAEGQDEGRGEVREERGSTTRESPPVPRVERERKREDC